MLSLFVFLLIVAETMPPTSDAVPLIGSSYSRAYNFTQHVDTSQYELYAHALYVISNCDFGHRTIT